MAITDPEAALIEEMVHLWKLQPLVNTTKLEALHNIVLNETTMGTTRKNIVYTLAGILSFVGIAVLGGGLYAFDTVQASKERIACSEYEKPQEIFKSDPVRYKRLDRDGDGLACESLTQ